MNITLKEYIERLQEFANNNKESLDLPVIYASDDLGSEYHKVVLKPSLMTKNKSVSYPNYLEYNKDEDNTDTDIEEPDAICIN